jgi:hypothetical protein
LARAVAARYLLQRGQVQPSGTLVKDLKEQISKVRGIPLPLGSTGIGTGPIGKSSKDMYRHGAEGEKNAITRARTKLVID